VCVNVIPTYQDYYREQCDTGVHLFCKYVIVVF